MRKKELKKTLKRFYSKSMIDSILRGARPMHMKHAITLHNEGLLELNSWANISKYLEKEEEAQPKEGEQIPHKASA